MNSDRIHPEAGTRETVRDALHRNLRFAFASRPDRRLYMTVDRGVTREQFGAVVDAITSTEIEVRIEGLSETRR